MSGAIVATVIAANGAELNPDFIKTLAANVKASRTAPLSAHAADIFCEGLVEDARAALSAQIADQPIDVLVQPVHSRRKKLLLADMESTIIEQEMLDELADMIGQRATVAAITRRAMNGELDFAAALRERVALLKGQPERLLIDAAKKITLMSGAAALVQAMKAQGAQCWLVSGGFTCFAAEVAQKLGFDRFFANELLVREGKIVGTVTEPILDRNTKKARLMRACFELKITPADCLAVGDGANDIPMLEACNKGGGLGVAFQAKPKVRDAVPNQINHGDLSALVYAQGLTPSSSRT
jgi:phosphoserine phosphatase